MSRFDAQRVGVVVIVSRLAMTFAAELTVGTGKADEPAIVAHVAEHREPGAVASIPWDAYAGDLRRLPIGVFDSGIGGLTVLEAVLKLDAHDNATGRPGGDGKPDFAGERFIYLGDQANMPYGNYSSVGRVDFLRELILRDALFLLGDRYHASVDAAEPRRDKPPVKAIVIACNTATAYGLEDIRAALTKWNVPVLVVGVVEAGGRGVVDAMRADTSAGAVAVLATVGTCDSGAYPKAIAKLAGQQGLIAPTVCQQGSVGLAGAIEGNRSFIVADGGTAAATPTYQGPSTTHPRAPLDAALLAAYGFDTAGLRGDVGDAQSLQLNSVENYVRYDVATLVEEYRKSGGAKPISTVVLGCTHFPLAAAGIRGAFARLRDYRTADGTQPYQALIAEQLTLIDPGEDTAKELYRGLFLRRQLIGHGEPRTACIVDDDAFYITVAAPTLSADQLTPDGVLTTDYKYSRLPGDFTCDDVRTVPLRSTPEGRAAAELWRTKLPHVAERLRD
ncbi:MAG: aspartate/glutamate racemase family protein [Planctomycetaceae bacterium]|nr:aspartate/glutamate racemase family protein [Planctomycetaceae bacterium]